MKIFLSGLLVEGIRALSFRVQEGHVEFTAGSEMAVHPHPGGGTVEIDGAAAVRLGESQRWVAFPRQDGWNRLYPVPSSGSNGVVTIVALDEREGPRRGKAKKAIKTSEPEPAAAVPLVSIPEPTAKPKGRPKGSRNRPKAVEPKSRAPATSVPRAERQPVPAKRNGGKSSPKPVASSPVTSKAPRPLSRAEKPKAPPPPSPAETPAPPRRSGKDRPWKILQALKKARADRQPIVVEKPQPKPEKTRPRRRWRR